jgi:hypothetical protein
MNQVEGPSQGHGLIDAFQFCLHGFFGRRFSGMQQARKTYKDKKRKRFHTMFLCWQFLASKTLATLVPVEIP